MSDPDLGDLDFTGLEVAVDLDDRRRVRIRWAGTDPGSLVRSGETGRRIAAAAGYHPALRFGALHGLGEGQPIGRPVAAVDPVVARREVSGVAMQGVGNSPEEPVAHAFRSGLRGIAGHERHPRGVAAEIDRREVGVSRAQLDIVEGNPEDFGHDRRQDVVRPLADVDRPTEQKDTAISVELELDLGVGHVVPIDGGARAAQVGTDGKAEATPLRHRGSAPEKAGAVDNLINTVLKPAARDSQPVDGARVGCRQVAPAQLDRIDPELFSGFVEMDLQRKPRLRCAVPALRAAGRLVGEEPHGFEPVSGDGVGGRLQGARVVGTCDAVAAVAAAIEEALKLHRGNPTAACEPCLDLHQHRVAASMGVKNLLTGKGDLDGAPGRHGELGGDELVREDVALPAESSPVGGGDHTDATHRQLEYLAQRAMHVVRRLRRSPERELAVSGILGDRGVLLHREMCVAFEEHRVFSNVLSDAHGGVGVAELQGHGLVHVRAAVDRLALGRKRLLDRHRMRQLRKLHVDQAKRLVGDPLVSGGHGRDRIAHVPNFLAGERLLVLADREDTELYRQVISGEDGQHSGKFSRCACIDAQNTGVGIRTTQDPAEQHSRQGQVVGELCLAADFGVGVGFGQRLAYDGKCLSHRCPSTPPARPPRRS